MPKHIYTFSCVWVISVFVALGGYFIWALDRGFEITDESYYLLLAMHPASVKLFGSAQHWFTSPIWLATGSLCLFRASGLLILLASAAILAKGALHAYTMVACASKPHPKDLAIVYACCMSGALLYGATINFSPCYNLFSSATAYAAIGITLLACGSPAPCRAWGCHVLAGCLLGIAFLNKFPAGLAVACLTLAFVVVFGETVRARVVGCACVLLGMLVTIIAVIGWHMQRENVVDEFRFGVEVIRTVQTEAGATRLLRYINEISRQMFWGGAWLAGLLACLVNFTRTRHARRYAGFAMAGVVILGCMHLPASFKTSSWLGVSDLLSTLMAITLIASISTWTKNLRAVMLTLGLVMLPYGAGAGTGNPINTQIVIAMSSWGGVIAILALARDSRGNCNGLATLACGIFTTVIAVQAAISGCSPYHLKSSIWQQTVPTQVGSIGMVKTDQETHEFVSSLTDIKNKHLAGGKLPYLGFYDVPGVALILDAIPVLSPWLVHQQHAECLLGRVDRGLLQSAIIGLRLEIDGALPALPRQVAAFPLGYTKAGEATCPFGDQTIQIWLPDNR
jgi:hypothetical protein